MSFINEPYPKTIIRGHGSESVYVYYFPQYYHYHDQYYWPCKIGMSRHSAVDRVFNQVKTSLPETPIIGLIIKCEHAYALEQMLHYYLTFKGRHVPNSPGTEWYNTTPKEIDIICNTLRIY